MTGLSARLRMNVNLVPEGASVADIGCDHGYAALYLAAEKNCRVIATDINKGPLQRAEEHIRQAGMKEKIECRLSDGTAKLLPGEADTLLVAGMGGMLICRILAENPAVMEKIDTLVLQPQSDWAQVRKTVQLLGYGIESESACEDAGKFYIAIRAMRGKPIFTYTEAEYAYGRLLPVEGSECCRRYLEREREKTERLAEELRRKSTPGARERIRGLSHILIRIDEALARFE